MIEVAEAASLSAVLAARGPSMLVCHEAPWLWDFREIPENAAAPLAMSGPHPRAVGSYGAEYREWMRTEYKVNLRWWQALAATRRLEHDADGALVYREIVETGPRRIGKSVNLRGGACWRSVRGAELFGEPQLSMLVSKDLAVGKEIHRPSWRWAESKGWNVLRLGGAQEIESPEGARWLLRAPNAAYGYDVGYGQVDESWGVDPMAITDGLEPALLERLSPQLHLTSTAHVKASSLMRRRLVAALRDADPDVLLLFWGAHPDADLSSEETWRAASPHWSEDRRALIQRKYAAALAGQDEPEFDDPDPVRGWAAQYLNVWPLLIGANADSLFPNWPNLSAPQTMAAPTALGIGANATQSWFSLAAASPGERTHVGAVMRSRSIDRADFISEVARIQRTYSCDVLIDPKGRASGLIDDLEDGGVTLKQVKVDDLILAHADFYSAYENGELEHANNPALNDALDNAGWRDMARRRVFASLRGDIDMLEAAALAVRGAKKSYDVLDSFY